MSQRLKLGVAGVGRMGTFHLQKYLAMDDIDVIGVYEPNLEHARAVAEKFGVRRFEKLEDLLFEVDGLSVAAPTASHYSIARQALAAGVHVLVEKPISDDLDEAEELVRLARAKNLTLQVGFIERFRYVALAKAFPVAPVRFIESHRLTPTMSREKSAIDVVSDLMIHDLDLALSLMGSEPIHVSAIGMPVLTDHYDIANVRLEFADGGVANLSASRVSVKPQRKFRTFSLSAYASMDFMTNSVELYFRDDKGGIGHRKLESSPFDALHDQLAHFVTCIRHNARPIVTGEDGVSALRVAQLIRRKIDERAAWKAPESPLADNPYFV